MSSNHESEVAVAILRRLTGDILDLERLASDAEELDPFIRFQEKLWHDEFDVVAPAPVFSASWEEFENESDT
jgi:hypothetical protein